MTINIGTLITVSALAAAVASANGAPADARPDARPALAQQAAAPVAFAAVR